MQKEDFISLYLNYTKDYESPTSFWKWSAYSIIAATLRDNAFFAQGLIKTYPNIYVILLADSAEYRKSPPLSIAKELLTEINNTKIISGHASIQGVLETLSQRVDNLRGGSCILLARELAAFFVDDPKLLPMLTDIYDFDPLFKYTLKGNQIEIKNLCSTFFGASNSEFFTDVYNSRATFGGLLRRTFIVTPDNRRDPNSLVNYEVNEYLYTKVVDALKKIAKLNGRFTMTKDAYTLYDTWYKELYYSYSKYEDKTGLVQSIHILILKLAMIITAADLTTVIDESHLKNAMHETLSLRGNYAKLVLRATTSQPEKVGAIIINKLMEAEDNAVEMWKFSADHWRDFTAKEFDDVLVLLERAQFITTIVNSNNMPAIQATQKCITRYLYDKENKT